MNENTATKNPSADLSVAVIAELSPADEIKNLLHQATTYERTKEPDLALHHFRQAKSLAKKHFGTDHFLYAECLHNLALFYYSQDEYVKARVEALHALEVLIKTLTSKEMHENRMWQDLVLLLQHL